MPTVLITGAGRGLGLEFARAYAAAGWDVIGTVRDPGKAEALRALGGSVRIEALDMNNLVAVAALAARIDGAPLDMLIANAGVSGPREIEGPPDSENWMETLRVNCVAPTLLATCLCDRIAAVGGKLIAISSQMGSIGDNKSGGAIAYRSSKAALNAAWRTLALDLANEPVIVAMLHPGWARTDMGGPHATLPVEESVGRMIALIGGLTRSQSGSFLNHDGAILPW